MRSQSLFSGGFVLSLVLLFQNAPRAGELVVERTTYHGWTNSIRLSNGEAEAIVVPAIGRVMQFHFIGEEGPFWENRALDGKAPDPKSAEWGNFGGDKTWPAPQAEWPQVAPRAWPPPPAFDSMPVEGKIEGKTVVLLSPVDPFFGIRTRRRIDLNAADPVMTITTTFEKVSGPPRKVGVWVITQFKHPENVLAGAPISAEFPNGYKLQSKNAPRNLQYDAGVLRVERDNKESHKVGSAGGTLFWVGQRVAVRIDSPRVADAEYPDEGASAEIYTNPDPAAYVELEMLGPLQELKPGDKLERTSRYTLLRKSDENQ